MINDALLVLGVVVVTLFVLWLGWRRRDARPSRERTPEAPPIRPAPEGLEQLTVELQSVSREIEARLDQRIDRARRLLEETEKAAARLESLLREARASASNGTVAAADPAREPHRATKPKEGAAGSANGAGADPDHAAIASLATEGLDPEEIARRVGRPVGEVQLILNLQRSASM